MTVVGERWKKKKNLNRRSLRIPEGSYFYFEFSNPVKDDKRATVIFDSFCLSKSCSISRLQPYKKTLKCFICELADSF